MAMMMMLLNPELPHPKPVFFFCEHGFTLPRFPISEISLLRHPKNYCHQRAGNPLCVCTNGDVFLDQVAAHNVVWHRCIHICYCAGISATLDSHTHLSIVISSLQPTRKSQPLQPLKRVLVEKFHTCYLESRVEMPLSLSFGTDKIQDGIGAGLVHENVWDNRNQSIFILSQCRTEPTWLSLTSQHLWKSIFSMDFCMNLQLSTTLVN